MVQIINMAAEEIGASKKEEGEGGCSLSVTIF